MDIITITNNNFPFDRVAWDIINFSIIGIAIIALIIVIMAEDKTITKVLSFLFVLLLPPIGSLFVFGRLLFRYSKRNKHNEVHSS